MNSSDVGTYVFSMGAALAIVTGCSGSPMPIGAPEAISRNSTNATAMIRIEERGAEPACRGSGCGWAPADFQARYNLPSGTNGKGQIVAVVDPYNAKNAASDLNTYRTEFGLGTVTFNKYNQEGEQGNYPPSCGSTSSGLWCLEEDLDIEMVSATCPNCAIDLVEANSAGFSDLAAAELEAVNLGAHIVTNSWTCYDLTVCTEGKEFDQPGVTYLASAGDTGSDLGAPAAFDSVAAIGGTILKKHGSRYGESVGTGAPGGCATGIPKPQWQHDTICAYRLTNDAAAVANGIAMYDRSQGGWLTAGGTGAASPLLAGVFALAGNANKQRGGRTFWLHHKYLYRLPGQCAYRHGQYTTCDGWGSPNGIGAF